MAVATWTILWLVVQGEGPEARLKRAVELLESGEIIAASDTLNALVEEEPEYLPARLELGKLYLRISDRQSAEETFQAAVAVDSTSAEAHHLLALSYVARGDAEGFSRAAEAFQTALRLDRNHPEALYNFASLLFMSGTREHLLLAQTLLERLQAVQPKYPGGREALEEVRDELAALRPTPKGRTAAPTRVRELNTVVGGELAPEEAMERYLAMVVPYTQKTAPGALWLDIKDIASEEEREAWERLDPSEQSRLFLRFWNRRDPFPQTPQNERLADHYGRLQFAREHFRSFKAEGYDERGRLYVRHGEPEERVRYDLIEARDAKSSRRTETWLYVDDRGDRHVFHFTEAGAGNFIIVDNILQVINPFRAFPEYPGVQDLRSEGIVPEIFFSRERIDARYGRLGSLVSAMINQPGGGLTANRQMFARLIEEDTFESAEAQQWASREITYHPPVRGKLIDVPQYAVQFVGPDGKSEVGFFFAIPPGALGEESWPATAAFEGALEFFDREWDSVWRGERSYRFDFTQLPPRSTAVAVAGETVNLPPGRYRSALGLEEVLSGALAAYQGDLTVRSLGRLELHLSDVVVAEMVDPTGGSGLLKRQGMGIHPLPTRAFLPDEPLYLYYELYGLESREGTARYTTEYTITSATEKSVVSRILSALGSLLGSEQEEGRVSLRYERTVPSVGPVLPEFVAIDLTNLKPSVYGVQVTVRDQLAGTEATQKTFFRILEP